VPRSHRASPGPESPQSDPADAGALAYKGSAQAHGPAAAARSTRLRRAPEALRVKVRGAAKASGTAAFRGPFSKMETVFRLSETNWEHVPMIGNAGQEAFSAFSIISSRQNRGLATEQTALLLTTIRLAAASF